MPTYFSSRPLTPAEVLAALTYHHDHPQELKEYLQRSERADEDIEAAKAEDHGPRPPLRQASRKASRSPALRCFHSF